MPQGVRVRLPPGPLWKTKNPVCFRRRGFSIIPAITDSRAFGTTMGPGCLTAVFGMGTGVAIQVCSPGDAWEYQQAAVGVAFLCTHLGGTGWFTPVVEEEVAINAAKRSAVSTGKLRPLLALHVRPIDQVVFLEPSSLRTGDLVSRGVSRLDAFSVYPSRTLATQRCR